MENALKTLKFCDYFPFEGSFWISRIRIRIPVMDPNPWDPSQYGSGSKMPYQWGYARIRIPNTKVIWSSLILSVDLPNPNSDIFIRSEFIKKTKIEMLLDFLLTKWSNSTFDHISNSSNIQFKGYTNTAFASVEQDRKTSLKCPSCFSGMAMTLANIRGLSLAG